MSKRYDKHIFSYAERKISMLEKEFMIKLTYEDRLKLHGFTTEVDIDRCATQIIMDRL